MATFLGRPVRAFVAGLMLLAGLILLAACANLGSLFAARAADRGAGSCACGWRWERAAPDSAAALYRSRADFTRRRRCRTVGQRRAVARAERVAAILPISDPCAGEPGCECLCDRLAAGVGERIPLRHGAGAAGAAGPIHTRSSKRDRPARIGRRITVRDLLLVVQIAICAVLVTSSMVAVRGLVRSLHSNFGFEPRNAMLVDTDLTWQATAATQCPPCKGA